MSRSERYLITQSLLGSWLYQYKAFDPEAAHEEFLKVLNRETTETTEAMQNGLDFENGIVRYCEGAELNQSHKWATGVKGIGDIVQGGYFQVPASKEKIIGGITYLLYGRMDVLKAGIIYDIKFSKSYECGKYITSPQHPMYFECCPEAYGFVYLVSNGSEVWREEYTSAETPVIDGTIIEFMQYLEAAGLDQVYFEKWKAM